MSFTCSPVQNEPNTSPWRKRLWALLLGAIGHVSSPSRSCLDKFILIHGGWGALWAEPSHTIILRLKVKIHDESHESGPYLFTSVHPHSPLLCVLATLAVQSHQHTILLPPSGRFSLPFVGEFSDFPPVLCVATSPSNTSKSGSSHGL